MVHPKNWLFCRVDGLTPAEREKKRFKTLESLALVKSKTVPVFEEAVQTAARLTQTPVCLLSLLVRDRFEFKSTVGLSSIDLMSDLAKMRSIPRLESYCQYVIDSEQPLILSELTHNRVLTESILFQYYGIRAYLGVPLYTHTQQCIGTLAVFDLEPHDFSDQDLDFLRLTARWCMSEYERDAIAKTPPSKPSPPPTQTSQTFSSDPILSLKSPSFDKTQELKVNLLLQLGGELRSPLTSVMGMARVLEQELYGPLTDKQKEYVEIIHNSGQQLLLTVEEMLTLDVLNEKNNTLVLNSVDMEMLCQQSLNNLELLAKQYQQTINLSIEPGNRIWLLDKDKIRQALYYLVYSLIKSLDIGSEIRIHVSRKIEDPVQPLPVLNLAVWGTHPWLDNNLPSTGLENASFQDLDNQSPSPWKDNPTLSSLIKSLKVDKRSQKSPEENSREVLGLLLSCHLVEMHGGKITIQGSPEIGYRYIFKIPQLEKKLN